MGGVRHPHCRQFSGPVAARQFLRVAAVGLDPVPGFSGDQTRRDYRTGNSHLRELPVEHVPSRTGLIAVSLMLDRSQAPVATRVLAS